MKNNSLSKAIIVSVIIIMVVMVFICYQQHEFNKRTKLAHSVYDKRYNVVIKNTLKQTFILFTIEDLSNFKITEPADLATSTNEYVMVRLRDGNMLCVGYFDYNGIYQSMIERKDNE